VDATGRVHLVWERLRGGRTVVEYMRGKGDRWTAPEEISAGGSRHPTVGLWARGVFALWQDRDGAVVLRVFDGRWGPPFHRPRRLPQCHPVGTHTWRTSPRGLDITGRRPGGEPGAAAGQAV